MSSRSEHTSSITKTTVRIFEWIKKDLSGLFSGFKSGFSLPQGLYSYTIANHDFTKKIHLRVEKDGAGVLFDNLTHIIHLNPTATFIAKKRLDGWTRKRIVSVLNRLFGGVQRKILLGEVNRVSDIAETIRTTFSGCPFEDLDFIKTRPIFSKEISAPYKVDLALTYTCNNRCRHCYNIVSRKSMPSLAESEWKLVLDKLARLGVPHIIFTGGEPTLHPSLSTLIRHADKNGQIAGLNTNGRLLAHRDFVEELVDAGLDHVQITLESSREKVHNFMTGSNSFDETTRGIKKCLNTSLHVLTNTTLTRLNIDHYKEIVNFLFDMGVHTFAMNSMIHSGKGRANQDTLDIEEISPVLRDVQNIASQKGMRFLWYTPTEYCRLSPVEHGVGYKRCNAGEYSMCIEPNGDVLPCQSYYVSVGNFLEDRWEDIWNSDLFLSFRNRFKDPAESGLPEKCWNCEYLDVCGGGCPLERNALSNKISCNTLI